MMTRNRNCMNSTNLTLSFLDMIQDMPLISEMAKMKYRVLMDHFMYIKGCRLRITGIPGPSLLSFRGNKDVPLVVKRCPNLNLSLASIPTAHYFHKKLPHRFPSDSGVSTLRSRFLRFHVTPLLAVSQCQSCGYQCHGSIRDGTNTALEAAPTKTAAVVTYINDPATLSVTLI